MKILFVIGVTIVIGAMFLIDWSSMNRKNQKKEKLTFVVLSFLGWSLAVFLIYFPEMPGPTQFIDWIFSPLGRILE